MPSKLIVLNGQRIWRSTEVVKLTPKDGEIGRKVQGGLPPVPYRSATPKWAMCPTKWAREPFQSKAIKMEVMAWRKAMG